MARHETIPIGQYGWTEVTSSDVASATFQVTGAHDVRIMGTVGAVAPVSRNVGIVYKTNQGEASRLLSDLFPGIAATRLYAISRNGGSKMFISHA